jgi:hypothetical protein
MQSGTNYSANEYGKRNSFNIKGGAGPFNLVANQKGDRKITKGIEK